jgi:tripartite-type tricarboxylate transporter receptor subunit TctC
MQFSRRRFVGLAAGAATVPTLSRVAAAADYPARPVHIVVGFAAGGPSDILTRLIGQWLSPRLGQQFVVENRPGAGGTIATDSVAHALPDGYALLQVDTSSAINASLYESLNFNLIRDIAPIAGISRSPDIMVVNPAFAASSVAEFIAYAKANPGKINMASGGTGTTAHLAGELFKLMAGVDMLHVPYRGGALALTDLMAAQVQAMFSPAAGALEHVRAGKLRALAVTTAARFKALPDVPTVASFLPGYEASTWNGLGAPRNTPAEIIDLLSRHIGAALADPNTSARLADIGAEPMPMAPAEFERFIADETGKWARVVKSAGIKPA